MNAFILKNSLKQLGLFSLVAALLLSCEKPEQNLGLGIQPEDDLMQASLADTITMLVTTELEDTLKTNELSTVMAGNYMDPVTGFHMASFYSQLRLSTNGIGFPLHYELDSVVLSLAYSGRYYGRLEPQELEVNEMTEPMYLDSTYLTRESLSYDVTQNLVSDDSVMIGFRPMQYTIVGGDSLYPQLRIPLDHSFGDRIMRLRDYSLASSERFQEVIPGLRVGSRTVDGAVINFDLTDSDTRLTLYYRDLDGDEPDTTSYAFIVNDLCARYTHLEHHYPGSALAGIGEQAPLDGTTMCYVQGGGATKIRIELPYLESLFTEGRTVNLAELVLPVSDLDNKHFVPQETLFILAAEENGTVSLLADQATANHTIGGTFDAGSQEYRFNITRWVQQVLSGELENHGLYVVSGSAGVSVYRAGIQGPEFSADNPLLNMRLRVIYSE